MGEVGRDQECTKGLKDIVMDSDEIVDQGSKSEQTLIMGLGLGMGDGLNTSAQE